MAEGTVKWFNDDKGFGFIQRDSGEDLFVHQTKIISEGFRSLVQGQRVNFEIQESEKGLSAVKVKPV